MMGKMKKITNSVLLYLPRRVLSNLWVNTWIFFAMKRHRMLRYVEICGFYPNDSFQDK